MVLAGRFLPTLLNEALSRVFARKIEVEKHIEMVVVIVVLLSVSPAIFAWLRSKLTSKTATQPRQEAAAS
jgi:hypothetical protein